MSPLRAVLFTQVRLERGFWAERIAVNRTNTIPTAIGKCEQSQRLYNFERAAARLSGDPLEDTQPPGYPFDDTDVYKVLEGAAYALAVTPDPELEQKLDEWIQKVEAAQEPDGYLYTTRTLCPEAPHPWAGQERWSLETDLSHELYNLGHLFEAAVAHHQATGKQRLLNVALRAATLLTRTFGPDKVSIWPGHQVTEMGLVRLYEVTGDRALVELARFLIDERGPDGKPQSGETYNQSTTRVTDQTEAFGHAVRATYMYAGMADIERATEGDAGYVGTLDRVWQDVVSRKLYITGGIGSRLVGEAFGDAYELPNLTAYCETCAAIGMVYFSQRMFLLHGRGDTIDVLERTLYNGLSSGVSLDGCSFFYPNPLESFAEYTRSPWFGCACCPGNIARFLASVPGYVYAQRGDHVYVNLFAAGTAELELTSGEKLLLTQETDYPWHGSIRLRVAGLRRPQTLQLSIRIPGWAQGQVVPSDLYRFSDEAAPGVELTLNGQPQPLQIDRGYVTLERVWQAQDEVLLNLPMPVRRLAAHPEVQANQGRVALQRGPLVFALEGHDQPTGEVLNLCLADTASLDARFQPDLLGGVVSITGTATALNRDADGTLRRHSVPFRAIPYYAWANRGAAEMQVWLARSEASCWVRPAPSIASRSRVIISNGDCPHAANDLAQPASSRDASHKRTRLEPDENGEAWIEYRFAQPERVAASRVYWFAADDWRNERPPASWRLLYLEGARWVEVRTSESYGVRHDCYNRVAFSPVTTSALRLVASAEAGHAIGLLEWQVDSAPQLSSAAGGRSGTVPP